jgi:hypothetical protein
MYAHVELPSAKTDFYKGTWLITYVVPDMGHNIYYIFMENFFAQKGHKKFHIICLKYLWRYYKAYVANHAKSFMFNGISCIVILDPILSWK